eukprot:GFYU01006927.1.p1 GENE.GFYU01006927.1~~GFYU01006927.1.p1  ORF type:complete len:582 (+),score=90.57 GFYU01006927.1:58-1803(+)
MWPWRRKSSAATVPPPGSESEGVSGPPHPMPQVTGPDDVEVQVPTESERLSQYHRSNSGEKPRDPETLFPLHAAILRDKINELKNLLKTQDALDIIDDTDHHGNTALHLAVILRESEMIHQLLAAGADPKVKNALGWTVLEEAVATRDGYLVYLVYTATQQRVWYQWQNRLPIILHSLEEFGDFYMEIRWEFDSNIIRFINSIAPSDTYKIWKKGSNLRVDTTLLGLDGMKCVRGNVSFLFQGLNTDTPGTLLMLNHDKKKITDALTTVRDPTPEELRRDVANLMNADMVQGELNADEMSVQPVTTWRGQAAKSQKIGPWVAHPYTVNGLGLSVTIRREERARLIYRDFDRYFEGFNEDDGDGEGEGEGPTWKTLGNADKTPAMRMDTASRALTVNDISEIVADDGNPSSLSPKSNGGHSSRKSGMSTSGKRKFSFGRRKSKDSEGDRTPRTSTSTAGGSSRRASAKSTITEDDIRSHTDQRVDRSVKANVWLCDHFPLGLHRVLPLTDILAPTNKHFGKIRDVLSMKLPPGQFPVRISIPIMMSINAVVTFERCEVSNIDEGVFKVPSGYQFQPRSQDKR